MKLFDRLASYSVAILLLVLVEGIMTLGLAFEFEKYNFVAWVCQVCALIVAFRLAEENVK